MDKKITYLHAIRVWAQTTQITETIALIITDG